jgi:hypothetical protein
MMEATTTRKNAHRAPLLEIAREELGIHSFERTGKPTLDVKLVHVPAVEQALERAYNFDLVMGHNVSRATHRRSQPPRNSEVEQEWLRAAANDMLALCWK